MTETAPATPGDTPQPTRRPWYRRPGPLAGLLVAAVVAAVGLALTQPWLVFVDERVDEALPSADAPDAPAPAPSEAAGESPADAGEPAETPTTPAEPPTPAGPVELARGDFISHEHGTTGTARVLELEDGSRVLRIEGLDTSNGPDLHVWLTDAPVIEGRDGWFVFDDGAFVDLGELRGNQGDQNYDIPADVDLATLTSVSIWCERFSVSFGAAELAPA